MSCPVSWGRPRVATPGREPVPGDTAIRSALLTALQRALFDPKHPIHRRFLGTERQYPGGDVQPLREGERQHLDR
jgi:hypothetical protein